MSECHEIQSFCQCSLHGAELQDLPVGGELRHAAVEQLERVLVKQDVVFENQNALPALGDGALDDRAHRAQQAPGARRGDGPATLRLEEGDTRQLAVVVEVELAPARHRPHAVRQSGRFALSVGAPFRGHRWVLTVDRRKALEGDAETLELRGDARQTIRPAVQIDHDDLLEDVVDGYASASGVLAGAGPELTLSRVRSYSSDRLGASFTCSPVSLARSSMNACPQYDIVLLSDFRFPGGTSSAIAEEIKANAAAGYRTALVQIEAPNLTFPFPINPKIRTLIDDRRRRPDRARASGSAPGSR